MHQQYLNLKKKRLKVCTLVTPKETLPNYLRGTHILSNYLYYSSSYGRFMGLHILGYYDNVYLLRCKVRSKSSICLGYNKLLIQESGDQCALFETRTALPIYFLLMIFSYLLRQHVIKLELFVLFLMFSVQARELRSTRIKLNFFLQECQS